MGVVLCWFCMDGDGVLGAWGAFGLWNECIGFFLLFSCYETFSISGVEVLIEGGFGPWCDCDCGG